MENKTSKYFKINFYGKSTVVDYQKPTKMDYNAHFTKRIGQAPGMEVKFPFIIEKCSDGIMRELISRTIIKCPNCRNKSENCSSCIHIHAISREDVIKLYDSLKQNIQTALKQSNTKTNIDNYIYASYHDYFSNMNLAEHNKKQKQKIKAN